MTILEGLFNRDISDNEISDALSKVFDISCQKIFITDDICSIDTKLDDIELLCENINNKGNFGKMITLYLRSENLKKADYLEQNIFIQLCNLLDCECLISDDSYNPYTMILIKNNCLKNVYFVPEDLDNEIYNIAEY